MAGNDSSTDVEDADKPIPHKAAEVSRPRAQSMFSAPSDKNVPPQLPRSKSMFDLSTKQPPIVGRARSNAFSSSKHPLFALQQDYTWRDFVNPVAKTPHSEVKDVLKQRKKNQREPGDKEARGSDIVDAQVDVFANPNEKDDEKDNQATEPEENVFKLQQDYTWRDFINPFAKTPHSEVKDILKNRKKNQRKPSDRQHDNDGDDPIVGRARADAFDNSADRQHVPPSMDERDEQDEHDEHEDEREDYSLQSKIGILNFRTPHKEVRNILAARDKGKKGETVGRKLKDSFRVGFTAVNSARKNMVEKGKAFAQQLADKFSSDGGGHGFSFFKDLLNKKATAKLPQPDSQNLGPGDQGKMSFSADSIEMKAFSAKVPASHDLLNKGAQHSAVNLAKPGQQPSHNPFTVATQAQNVFKSLLQKAQSTTSTTSTTKIESA